MDFRPVVRVVGVLLLVLTIFMLIPAAVMLFYHEPHWQEFLLAAAATAGVGAMLAVAGRKANYRLTPRQAFLLTAASWFAVGLFAALPLVLVEHIDYSDAFFETMSGVTTTGSTVLTNLEQHTRGILVWRSLLQWIGGIGFVAVGIAILPFLRIGGMRLFRSESSEWTERVTPRFGSFARAVVLIYLILTVLAGLGYWFSGMSIFDAVNHAMTTVSTGGYSTSDASFGRFEAASVRWVAVVFMLLSALPFSLYIQVWEGKLGALWFDRQVQGLLRFVLFVAMMLTLWLWLGDEDDFMDVLTRVMFNVVSIATTTGFVTEDYGQWGAFATMIFFFLTFVGGCSGSTAGGMKIFRFQVAYISLKSQLGRLVHPHVVITEQYNKREITDDVVRSLVAFSFFFALTISTLAIVLAFFGLDFTTSLSGAVTAVTNVGPGLGSIIGPAGHFATIPDPAKWALSIGMLLGRLEIMTVVVLFTPRFWHG